MKVTNDVVVKTTIQLRHKITRALRLSEVKHCPIFQECSCYDIF